MANEEPRRPAMLPSMALAALAGVLYFLAFPGFDLWPLAFVAFVPMLWALDARHARSGAGHGTRRVVLLGWLFGVVTNAGGYYWLVGMLQEFSGFPLPLCVLFALVVCAFQGGLLALFAWLYHRARQRGHAPLLSAPLAFGAAEMVYPLLFPSYYANHFHGVPALIQIADLGGPILISVLAIAVNAALYELLRARMSGRPLPRRGPAAVLVALGLTLGYGAYRIARVDARAAASEAVKVGVVQANMGIFAKREDPGEGRRRHIEMTQALEREYHPDLVIWPESAISFFLPPGGNVKRFVMGPVQTPLLFGGLSRRRVDGHLRDFNTAFLADGEGHVLGTYDKTYLLAFGEYIPFGETFPSLYDVSAHSGRFTPGDHVRPLRWRDHRISVLICYEDIIPRFVRRAVLEGDPDLLVNITNDAWFGDTSEPWQHLALSEMRAVEHHRYLVRATNSGVSAIIDPVGRLRDTIDVQRRGTIRGRVRMMRGWTPYQTFGDWPGWASIGAVVVIAFLRRRGALGDRRGRRTSRPG